MASRRPLGFDRRMACVGLLREGAAHIGCGRARAARARYPSNVATVNSVNLSGSNSPAWASSTILIATSSMMGNASASDSCILVRTCSKALCIASIWSGRKDGALRR